MKTKYQIITFIILGALLLVGSLGLFRLDPPAAEASNLHQSGDMQRTITVVGQGQVSAAPDIAVINMGVQVSNPDVKEATAQAAAQMESLLAALKGEGIAEKDIQTSYYNVYVERPYGPQGPSDEAIYQVSNTVQVTIRDLSSVTDILGIAIEAGANSINNIEFRLSDPAQLRSEARAKAVENAEASAAELAELNGLAVGPVVSISEVIDSGAYFVNEQSYAAAEGRGGGGAGPISPGDVTINMQLQIIYAVLQ